MIEERLCIGSQVIVLERPPDIDSLIDESAFERDEYMPYWAELWPSGIALATHLTTFDVRSRRVVELGCGLALPSLICAAGGADVVATDWAPAALELVARNAARNGSRLRTLAVRWDEPQELERHGPFDLALASDVLYEPGNAEQILGILGRVLTPTGEALVADPGRRHAPSFLETARAQGWVVETRISPLLPMGSIQRLWAERRTIGTGS